MSNIIKYKMKLEVLTPLHIGGADYKSKLDKKECESLVERILELSTASEIKNEVKEFMKNID